MVLIWENTNSIFNSNGGSAVHKSMQKLSLDRAQKLWDHSLILVVGCFELITVFTAEIVRIAHAFMVSLEEKEMK